MYFLLLLLLVPVAGFVAGILRAAAIQPPVVPEPSPARMAPSPEYTPTRSLVQSNA